jgi:superfamily I DNA/RNA helicase
MLRLPTSRDLSDEQRNVQNMPPDGVHLVVGPPGSGKTVVALYRAQNLSLNKQGSVVLMYNHTLVDYVSDAARGLKITGCTVTTQHAWFYKWYKDTFGVNAPESAPYTPHWDVIIERLEGSSFTQIDHVLVDEGQDFHPMFYRVIRRIARNVMVFADENQRIGPQNSTLDQLRRNLQLPTDKVKKLTRNYRNSQPIAEFAAQFYTDLQSGIPVPPTRAGDKPALLLGRNTYQMVELIDRAATNNKTQSIGVLLPNTRLVRSYYNRLNPRQPERVQMYESGSRIKMDFEGKQITVLTYQSAKGLEFDRVYLPELHDLRTDTDLNAEKMKFYVLCSRARDGLTLATAEHITPGMMGHVPTTLYEQR